MKILKVVGCFVEYNWKILIGKRRPDKSEWNTRGIPAGKIEKWETKRDACIRELSEEVGIVASINDLEFIWEYTINSPDQKVLFATFRLKLTDNVEIILNDWEVTEYKWISPQNCYEMDDLIYWGHQLLKLTGYYSPKNQSKSL